MRTSLVFLFFIIFHHFALGQLSTEVIFKKVDTISLKMRIYYPTGYDTTCTYPAIVFFYGGGWYKGSLKQFEQHAQYFSRRGMVSFLAEYRVHERHRSSPLEALKDAKSAMRYVRKNADKYQLDTNRIAAAGGSAGGQLAAATALVAGFNEKSDDLNVSAVPGALVLFNPVIDNGPGGFGFERVEDLYKDFSPLHNIRKGAPPTIIFLGTQDHLVPVNTINYYKTVMGKVGSRCDVVLYEGEEHGFFNYRNLENYRNTVYQADTFLISLGFLRGTPLIRTSND